MKRMFMIAVALFAAFSLSAQEPGKFRLVRPDSTRTGSFRLPDSLRVEMSVPDSLVQSSTPGSNSFHHFQTCRP